MKKRIPVVISVLMMILASCSANQRKLDTENVFYLEKYRPQYHFSPEKMWTNDPNGLLFFDGEYHLFYQFYPDSTVWGPMHWGHAVSNDILHWKHLPVALYPDSLGYIFSGSAVVDTANTSGFGLPGRPAMVAIFTYHNSLKEKSGRIDYQYQALAYSTDKGRTWTKYAKNPVIPNPGMKDFRDPNVSWNNDLRRWILILAAGDRLEFYSSSNLIDWKFESDFGKNMGAHGGVWECPSLFQLDVENEPGKKMWVLLVSINPGGPLGGSATQYFTGSFDGHNFKNNDNETRWVDYGPDNYAGIPWSNTGNRRIFMGWMNNWKYADKLPTSPWRGQMTIPRDLTLVKSGKSYLLRNFPVPEIDNISAVIMNSRSERAPEIRLDGKNKGQARIDITFSDSVEAVNIEFSNELNQKILFGFNRKTGEIYSDRSLSGETQFSREFSKSMITVPATILPGENYITLLIDQCSVEFFINKGLAVMTSLCFPGKEFNVCRIHAIPQTANINFKVTEVESVWK